MDKIIKNNKDIILVFLAIIIIVIIVSVAVHYSKEVYECKERKIQIRCASLSETNMTCYPNYDNFDDRKRCSGLWKIKTSS